MKKPLNLPKFTNEDEERKFWDTIDITDYFEPEDFKRVTFPNLKPTRRLISIRLPEDLIAKVKQEAQKQDIPYQQLIRHYIQRGVGQSNR
jgi:predicted DNA binding CopG/RHH family protein